MTKGRRNTYRRQPVRRRSSYGRRSYDRRHRHSQGQPSMFWGRALMTVVVLFCIWAWAKGQA